MTRSISGRARNVFREIEVIDKIVAAARDAADNPLEPITMIVTVKE